MPLELRWERRTRDKPWPYPQFFIIRTALRSSCNRYCISGPNLSPLPRCSCPLRALTFAGLPVRLQHEAHGAAAVDACGCIVALTITAPVVDSTGLCLGGRWRVVIGLLAWRSPKLEGSREHRGSREGLSCLPVLSKEHSVEAPSPLPPTAPSPHPLTSAAKQSASLPPT